jgi:hypothetical protein
MSEQELVFKVKELNVLSLTCSECGHGTLIDFKNSDYLARLVSSQCSICNTELTVDLQEQLKAYGCFYSCMASRDRIEFRVRMSNPQTIAAGAAASHVQKAISSTLGEVQEAVSRAFARERELADAVITLIKA